MWILLLGHMFLLQKILLSSRGLFTYLALRREIARQQEEIADLQKKAEIFTARIDLLQDKSLDLTLLEEQAKAVLGLVKPDEIQIIPPPLDDRAAP